MQTLTQTRPGRFGDYGGRYVPETLMAALEELEPHTRRRRRIPLPRELDSCCATTPAAPRRSTSLQRLTERWAAQRSISSAKTCCTPARTRSTTAWARGCSRGAWASTASSRKRAPASTASPPLPSARCFGMECVVYMGEEDMRRQELNVFRMRLLGAEVRGVTSGSAH